MWGFFSKDPLKEFGYEIGDSQDDQRSSFSLWSFHSAKKKGSAEEFSGFVANLRPGEDYQFAAAKNGYKRSRSLRHPNILAFHDGVETDKTLYIVTEPVTPLRTYLQQNQLADFQLAWGIYQIAKAVWFLNKDGQLVHNAVCIWNVFVTRSGDWKLGGLDFASPTAGDFVCPKNLLPALERYWPPVNQKNVDKWCVDSFGLGCLIWEVFNCPSTYDKPQSLKVLDRIPKNVVNHFMELTSPQASQRPSAQSFIDSCRGGKGSFFDTPFFNNMLFVEEIQLKDNTERLRFLERLPSQLDQFPEDVRRYKLLPQLISALDYAADSGPAILGPLVKIGKLLESTEYQAKIVPCIVKLFASPDRQTRVRLLAQMEDYVEHLSVAVVNDQIYPHLSLGFNDVNPVVREATVKSIASLAPKLNNRNLNEDILRNFSRLQSRDDQPGVRVNTTVCIGKIAPCLNPQTRQRVLAPALARSLRDPFSPARQAGILALVATAQFYSLAETAGRVVPAICPLMADPDQAVRQQAFRGIKGFLEKLEKASENPSLIPELEKHVNSTSSVAGGGLAESASSWAGWAFTSMSSLMTKVQKQQQQQQQQQQQLSQEQSELLEQQQPAAKRESRVAPPSAVGASSVAPIANKSVPSSSFQPRSAASQDQQELGGWDDFDVNENIEVTKPSSAFSNGGASASNSKRLEMSSAVDDDTSAMGASEWGDDDNWLPLDEPVSTTSSASKPAQQKSSTAVSSGWGDFDDDSFSAKAAVATTKPISGTGVSSSSSASSFKSANNKEKDPFSDPFEAPKARPAPRPTTPSSADRPLTTGGGATSSTGKAGPLKLGAKKLT